MSDEARALRICVGGYIVSGMNDAAEKSIDDALTRARDEEAEEIARVTEHHGLFSDEREMTKQLAALIRARVASRKAGKP